MVNLTDLYRNQGLDGEAEPMLRRAVAADPGYAPAYHALGLLLGAPARLARRAHRTPKGCDSGTGRRALCLCLCCGAQLGAKATDARCGYRKLCPTRDGMWTSEIMACSQAMLSLIEQLFGWLASFLRSQRWLQAENLVLRHQLNILRRQASGRVRMSNADRLAFVWLYRLYPIVADAVAIIRRETVVRWHRRGFGALWRWKSRSRGGRPQMPREIRDLI